MKTEKRMISEFMRNHAINSPHLLPESQLNYDNDWSMLIPVFEKIRNLHSEKFKYDAVEISCGNWPKDEEYIEILTIPIGTPIDEVYKKLVIFIHWYNSQDY